MNKWVWNVLGGLTVLAAIYVLSWIPETLPTLPSAEQPKFIAGMLLLGSVLLVIAATCFFPKSRPFTLRILGAIGVIGCLFNLVHGWQQHNFSQYPIILVFLLPGSIYLVVKGRMPDELS